CVRALDADFIFGILAVVLARRLGRAGALLGAGAETFPSCCCNRPSASMNICFLRCVRTFSRSCGLPVIVDRLERFCFRYKSWYFPRNFRARTILDLRRTRGSVPSTGGKLLSIKLHSFLVESVRASLR